MKNWFKTNTDSSPKDKKWWKPNISWLKLIVVSILFVGANAGKAVAILFRCFIPNKC